MLTEKDGVVGVAVGPTIGPEGDAVVCGGSDGEMDVAGVGG